MHNRYSKMDTAVKKCNEEVQGIAEQKKIMRVPSHSYACKMTYIVSGGTLNYIHSLT